MHDNDNRPDLNALLAADASARRAFNRHFRRQHPLLAAIAWVAESNWRIAGMIVAALIVGSLFERILP